MLSVYHRGGPQLVTSIFSQLEVKLQSCSSEISLLKIPKEGELHLIIPGNKYKHN